MSGLYNEFQVRLHRDGVDTPWGFRLQGGSDFNSPLTVQRVFACSPAEGELQRGDVILQIESKNVESFLHKQAQDLIKKAGATILFKIRRGGTVRPPLQPRVSQQVGLYPHVPDRRKGFDNKCHFGLQTTHSRVESSPYTALAPGAYVRFNPERSRQVLEGVQSTLEYAVVGHKLNSQFDDWEPSPPAPTYQPYQPTPTSPPVYNDMGSRGGYGAKIPSVATQVGRTPNFGVDYTSKKQEAGQPNPYIGMDYNSLRKAKPRDIAPPPSFGVDYRPPRKSVNTDRQTPPREADYLYAPVGEIKKKFGATKSDQENVHRTGRRWQPPDPSATGGDRVLTYGWSADVNPDANYTPGPAHDQYKHSPAQQPPSAPPTAPKPSPPQQQQQYQMVSPPVQPKPQQQQQQQQQQEQMMPFTNRPIKSAVQTALEEEQSGSWSGSLRPMGGTRKPWEIEAERAAQSQEEIERLTQQTHEGHVGGRTISIQHQPSQPTAHVVHLQYNSPTSLYSRANAQATLYDQTHGRPGQGTMKITGGAAPVRDITESSTYRMIHEEEQNKPKAARYVDFGQNEIQYSGFQDQNRQSGAFMRLAEVTGTEGSAPSAVANVTLPAPEPAAEDIGSSDF